MTDLLDQYRQMRQRVERAQRDRLEDSRESTNGITEGLI